MTPEMLAIVERWLPIPGWEGLYDVSDQGRVRSLDRVVEVRRARGGTCLHPRRGRLLRAGRSANGYLTVCLQSAGRKESTPVQWLVAAAFIGPRPPGLIVCHNDGCKQTNVPDNLRYDTYAANQADMDRHGTRIRGERYSNSKLTDERVRQIRREAQKSQAAFAEEFNVSPAAIQAVRDGRTWAHVR